jgi:hypothetical protein
MLDRPYLFPSRPIIELDPGEWQRVECGITVRQRACASHLPRTCQTGRPRALLSCQPAGIRLLRRVAKESHVAFGVYSPLRECPGASVRQSLRMRPDASWDKG